MPSDDSTQLKKRARRRLIGAVALALLAAIVLPMVMDHQPAPPLKDIQVRIPSPDEGVSQRVAPSKPVTAAAMPEPAEKPKPAASPSGDPVPPLKPLAKEEYAPLSAKPVEKAEIKPIAKAEPKPEPTQESKPAADEAARAQNALTGKAAAEAWEVQLGAYQDAGRVKLLLVKLKEMGVPTYTEKVDTPNGPRTRVRAGPYPSQEAAEKARVRVKIIGVDGPVAKKH